MMRYLVRGVILCLALQPWLPATAADDPVLADLIMRALRKNPSLEAMQHRRTAAAAGYRQSRASLYPHVGLQASYTHTDNPPQVFMQQLNQGVLDMQDPTFDPNEPDDWGNLRTSLGLQYRLLDATRSGQQAAASALQQAAAQHEHAARNELVHTVTRSYYHVLQAQVQAQVREAALRSLEESLRVALERFNSGATLKTDVLNLEVQVAQAEENLIRARNGIRLAMAVLHAAIGESAAPKKGFPIPEHAPPAAPPQLPAEDAAAARPEALASAFLVDAAQAQLRAQRGQGRPSVDLFASSDWDTETLDDVAQSYTAGIALQWPWFTGRAIKSGMQEARALLEAARAQHARILLDLQLDLEKARIKTEEAWARLPVAAKAVGSAEEALRITHAQYREGATDLTALLVAETGLTETRMRQTAATYAYQIARSNLDRAAGRLATYRFRPDRTTTANTQEEQP